LIALLIGSPESLLRWGGIGLFVFIALPYVVARLHLAGTKELREADKQAWERQMGWGASGFLVSPFYLIRRDRRLLGRSKRL
jgi:hypothetical protein